MRFFYRRLKKQTLEDQIEDLQDELYELQSKFEDLLDYFKIEDGYHS